MAFFFFLPFTVIIFLQILSKHSELHQQGLEARETCTADFYTFFFLTDRLSSDL